MRNIWQFLTENRFPEIKHSHDIWHAAKNLGKKVVAAGQNKECRELLEWSRDIVNHFWYSCSYATDVDSFMVSRYLFVLHLVYLLCCCSDWNWNMLITSFINPYAIRSYSKLICMLIALLISGGVVWGCPPCRKWTRMEHVILKQLLWEQQMYAWSNGGGRPQRLDHKRQPCTHSFDPDCVQ